MASPGSRLASPKGRRAWLALRLLVTVGLLAVVLRRVDPGEAAAAVAGAPWWIVPVATSLYCANTLLYALRLVALVPGAGAVGALVRGSLVANFAALVLPSGGAEAAKVVTLAPALGGPETALAAITTVRLLELLTWAGLLSWAAWAVLPRITPWAVWPAALVGLGMAAGSVTVLVGSGLGGRLGDEGPGGAVGRFLRRTGQRLALFTGDRRRLAASWLLTLPFAAVNCLTAWLVLRVYGVPLTYPEALGLVPAVDVIMALPITVSGIGVREAVWVATLVPLGVTPETALAVAFTRWAGALGRAAVGGVAFAWEKRG